MILDKWKIVNKYLLNITKRMYILDFGIDKKFLLRHECWANNKRGLPVMDDASFMTDYMLYIVVRARIMCVP